MNNLHNSNKNQYNILILNNNNNKYRSINKIYGSKRRKRPGLNIFEKERRMVIRKRHEKKRKTQTKALFQQQQPNGRSCKWKTVLYERLYRVFQFTNPIKI